MDFVSKQSVETLPQYISIFGGLNLNTSYDCKAIQAAGLVDTLAGPGPFTVFAPTNLAFDKIPKEALAGLLEDKDALTSVLLRHVVPAKLMGKVWCATVDWWCENLQYMLIIKITKPSEHSYIGCAKWSDPSGHSGRRRNRSVRGSMVRLLSKSSETLDSNFCLQNGYKTGVLWRTILIHSRYNIKYVTIKSSAGEATVSDFDIEATNGVVHIVDHVFWFVMLLYHTSLFCQIICCSERICVFFQFGRFFQTFLLCSSNFAGQGAEKVNIVFK